MWKRRKAQEMKDRCVDCEKSYHPKDDFCRRCEFEDAKWKFIDELAETRAGKFVIRILIWLAKILEGKG